MKAQFKSGQEVIAINPNNNRPGKGTIKKVDSTTATVEMYGFEFTANLVDLKPFTTTKKVEDKTMKAQTAAAPVKATKKSTPAPVAKAVAKVKTAPSPKAAGKAAVKLDKVAEKAAKKVVKPVAKAAEKVTIKKEAGKGIKSVKVAKKATAEATKFKVTAKPELVKSVLPTIKSELRSKAYQALAKGGNMTVDEVYKAINKKCECSRKQVATALQNLITLHKVARI